VAGCAVVGAAWAQGPTFRVSFDEATRAEPATGRLVVHLIAESSSIPARTEPADGPFWSDPQPLFGIDVHGLHPGEPAEVGSGATGFPVPLAELPAGIYRAQAVLDLSRSDSNWRREAGNLWSGTVRFEHAARGAPTAVEIRLDRVVRPDAAPPRAGAEYIEVRSELLSEFHGREVTLRAGVLLPLDRDVTRRYAAVYEIPGFGGDHTGLPGERFDRTSPDSPMGMIRRQTAWVALNPESPNGHTLFADSANNGPVGAALVQELIPAIEEKYGLIPEPSARLLRGHSSGGWSALWLALQYPEVFGACWSSAPDPVDLRRFQLVDLYASDNFYVGPDGVDLPSLRTARGPTMTIRQENLMEEVLGPGNTSGQQWDSWLAVWGPRGADGNPAALFDPVTGAIDAGVREHFRAYDIGHLLRSDPGRYLPIFRERVRLVVGDADSFYLNEAVALLKADVERLAGAGPGERGLPSGAGEVATRLGSAVPLRDGGGYIAIVPGADHSSVFRSREVTAFPAQMVDHLRAHGHLK